MFPRKYVWPLESSYHNTRLSDPNFVLSYKSWVNRLLWALNSLQLILRNKHALPCWFVLLIKGDMYLWIHPTFFHVIQLIHISWAIYISWYAFFLRKKKKHSAQLHAPFLGKEAPNDCSDILPGLQTQQPIFPFGSITLLDGDSSFLPFSFLRSALVWFILHVSLGTLASLHYTSLLTAVPMAGCKGRLQCPPEWM